MREDSIFKASDDKLFKVIHPDTGADWTNEELQEYAINNTNLVYCDIEGFLVDEYGALYIADECGNFDILPPDWFKLVLLTHDGSPTTVVYNTHEYRRVD